MPEDEPDPPADGDHSEDAVVQSDDPVDRIHAHLQATEELPLDPTANRWLGEAQAVAADLVEHPADEETARRRVERIDELLAEVDSTGDGTADDHVRAAREAAAELLGDRD